MALPTTSDVLLAIARRQVAGKCDETVHAERLARQCDRHADGLRRRRRSLIAPAELFNGTPTGGIGLLRDFTTSI